MGTPIAEFYQTNHSIRIMNQIKLHYKCELLNDVVLVSGIDGERFPAHRLILSANSDYFLAMFNRSWSEMYEKEVILGLVHSDDLRNLVSYCYKGYFELDVDNVVSLLNTARMLQFDGVARTCIKFLSLRLDSSNCVDIALLAEELYCEELLKDAHNYMCLHFVELSEGAEFFKLNVEQLGKLLSSDDIEVTCEEQVFQCVMAWVEHEQSVRRQYIPELFALLRLPFLQPAFFTDHVRDVCNSNGCIELALEYYQWHAIPERRFSLVSKRTQPRVSFGTLLAVGQSDMYFTIERYSPRAKQWTTLKRWVKYGRVYYSSAILNDKVIFVGGMSRSETVSTVESLDLKSMTWMPLPAMNTDRKSMGIAVLKGFLYVVGGRNNVEVLDTVERWDPELLNWDYVAPMTTKRHHAGVIVLNNRLYAIGGKDDASAVCSVECYDSLTNEWTFMAPMNTARAGVGLAELNGFLYVIGGCSFGQIINSVERYDPNTNTWTSVCSLSVARCFPGSAVLGNRLIASGGRDSKSLISTFEEYNAELNVWSEFTPMNTSKACFCALVVPNNLIQPVVNKTVINEDLPAPENDA